MAAPTLTPEQILAWANLGATLLRTGVVAAEGLKKLLHLAHGPLPDAEVQKVLKTISDHARELAAAAALDAGETIDEIKGTTNG